MFWSCQVLRSEVGPVIQTVAKHHYQDKDDTKASGGTKHGRRVAVHRQTLLLKVQRSTSHWGLNKDGTNRQKEKLVLHTAITTGEGDVLPLGYTMFRPILHFQIRKQITARQRLLITCEATRRRAAAVATLVAVGATKQPMPRRRVRWKRPFLLGHDEQGAYPSLVRELANDDLQSFCNFLRMTPVVSHNVEINNKQILLI